MGTGLRLCYPVHGRESVCVETERRGQVFGIGWLKVYRRASILNDVDGWHTSIRAAACSEPARNSVNTGLNPFCDYAVGINNCGTWSRLMLEGERLRWPSVATLYNLGGAEPVALSPVSTQSFSSSSPRPERLSVCGDV